MPLTPLTSIEEIKAGRELDPLEFGDLLFKNKINHVNSFYTAGKSHLIYGWLDGEELVWTDASV